MATTSLITDKQYGSTQTDPVNPSMEHYSVTTPSKVYHAMVAVCRGEYDGHHCFQNSSNHHISGRIQCYFIRGFTFMLNVLHVEQKSVSCQTDFESSGDADQNKRSGTTDDFRAIDDKTGNADLESSDDSDSVPKQSDSSLKKTPSGKHYGSNCRVMIPRLTDEMIRALISPPERLPKILCKTSIEQKSKASDKRSASPDHEQQRTKQVKGCQSREMFHTLARSIESLADSDTNVDSMIDQDDLQSWCVDEAVRVLEKCKHRPSGRSLHSQQK